MSEKTSIAFIISHGDLAFELKKVSEKLTATSIELFPFSNSKLSLEEIENLIIEKIDESNADYSYIFVDLMGGSCWIAANRVKRQRPDSVILSGVNLALLLSFQINQPKMAIDDLIVKITEDAKKGIASR